MHPEDTTGGAASEDVNTATAFALEPSSQANFVERNTIVLKTHDGDGYVLPYLPWDASPSTRCTIFGADLILVDQSPNRRDIQASTPRAPSGSHQRWQLQYTGREPEHYLAHALGASRQPTCNTASELAIGHLEPRYRIPVPPRGRDSLRRRHCA